MCLTNIAIYRLWLALHVSFSYVFIIIGLVAGHHHPDIYHHGDATRDNPDWGLCQLDAIRDRWVGGIGLVSFLVLHFFSPCIAYTSMAK